jgi:peptidoglycan/LPS O-acetylase OafA/YrhL
VEFLGRASRATALYLSNVFFSLNAANYFAPPPELNPMQHTWSLAVEEQFYLFWPLLIMLGLQFFRSRKILFTVLTTLTLTSLATCLWFTAQGGTFAFYQLPARAWEFGIGGLAVLISWDALKIPMAVWSALGWLGILTVLGSAYWISGVGFLTLNKSNFPGSIALFPVMGTVFTLVACATFRNCRVAAALNWAPLQKLGKLSYSWYLWHWPFLIFAEALIRDISVAGRVAVAGAALLVSYLSYRFVENPVRFNPWLMAHPVRSIYLGLAITTCSFVAATLTIHFAGHLKSDPQIKSIAEAVDDVSRLPEGRCVQNEQDPKVLSCVYGDRASDTSIVLFGDSHAVQWFNPLQRLADSQRWKLTTLVKLGCPPADLADGLKSKSCPEWRADAIRQIEVSKPTLVVIASSVQYLGRPDLPGWGSAISLTDWREGSRATFRALAKGGLRIAFIRDCPFPAFDIPTCLARSRRDIGFTHDGCNMAEKTVLNPAVFLAEQNAAEGIPGIDFIDVSEGFCKGGVCWADHDGDVVYRDANHVTGRYADHLLPLLAARLLPIVMQTHDR